MNYKKNSEATGGQMTLFSQVASRNHANHTQAQVSDLGKRTNAIYGLKCLEQYEKLSRPTLWAKTFVACLIGTGDWYSTKCVLTWKILAIKSRHVLYLRAVSTPRIDENEFGLLPTATAQDFKRRGPNSKQQGLSNIENWTGLLLTPTTREEVQDLDKFKARMEKYPNGTIMPNLATQIMGLLPTPTAMDSNGATANMKSTQVKEGSMHSVTLSRWAGMLPTPTTRDWKGAQANEYKISRGEKTDFAMQSLPGLANKITGTTSQLNPRFVLEMMGFSPTHTLRPFQKKETTWTEI